jgi:hypothetical protein
LLDSRRELSIIDNRWLTDDATRRKREDERKKKDERAGDYR